MSRPGVEKGDSSMWLRCRARRFVSPDAKSGIWKRLDRLPCPDKSHAGCRLPCCRRVGASIQFVHQLWHYWNRQFHPPSQLPSRVKCFGGGRRKVMRVQGRKRGEVVVFTRRVAGGALLVDCWYDDPIVQKLRLELVLNGWDQHPWNP